MTVHSLPQQLTGNEAMTVSLKAEMSCVYLHPVNLLSKVTWNPLDGKYKQHKKFSWKHSASFGKFGDSRSESVTISRAILFG